MIVNFEFPDSLYSYLDAEILVYVKEKAWFGESLYKQMLNPSQESKFNIVKTKWYNEPEELVVIFKPFTSDASNFSATAKRDDSMTSEEHNKCLEDGNYACVNGYLHFGPDLSNQCCSQMDDD